MSNDDLKVRKELENVIVRLVGAIRILSATIHNSWLPAPRSDNLCCELPMSETYGPLNLSFRCSCVSWSNLALRARRTY